MHDRGVTAPLLEGIGELLQPKPENSVLDAGCGDGYYLGSLAGGFGFKGCGVDISIPAIDAAARRYPDCQWLVANADRLIPYPDRTFDFVLSITARRNAPEFRRVLKDDGSLLVAIPAPDDLIELRGTGRDRVARTIAEFEGKFSLVARRRVTATAELDAAAVGDVLLSIYRPMQPMAPVAQRVTFSLDLLLFRC